MPRRLRIEFEGAIYHVMSRGNARQDIVHDDEDRTRLLLDLERTVNRFEWDVLAFVIMSNHLHLLLKTPRPNLGKGMQGFLSAYALWSARRRRRPGHLFQGRYKAEMIEDESYYWTVSRYIHLNPVRAALVARPEDWAWSSYPGYVAAGRRREWVRYETLLAAWRGDWGGNDAAGAYRGYVEAGLTDPPASPFRETFGGWVLGSSGFVERLRALVGGVSFDSPLREALQLTRLDAGTVLAAVSEYYELEAGALSRRHARHIARAMAAWLCRRHTLATLSEIAAGLGLSRADSVPCLVRRLETRLKTSAHLSETSKELYRSSPKGRARTWHSPGGRDGRPSSRLTAHRGSGTNGRVSTEPRFEKMGLSRMRVLPRIAQVSSERLQVSLFP
jgi:putative transposase